MVAIIYTIIWDAAEQGGAAIYKEIVIINVEVVYVVVLTISDCGAQCALLFLFL